jgi:hypothetical protein
LNLTKIQTATKHAEQVYSTVHAHAYRDKFNVLFKNRLK